MYSYLFCGSCCLITIIYMYYNSVKDMYYNHNNDNNELNVFLLAESIDEESMI